MIVSENSRPSIEEFRRLMSRTDELLNREAVGMEDYYSDRNGSRLEEDVFDALRRCAVGTAFDGSIVLVSGSSFPDIIANRFYGVEVKSTNKNHWRSIGSSILESTRNADVERIFLTFGKLGRPVSFKSRPYEECLSGISVTHYPRYQIDMELPEGETIFDKMGVPYDELRRLDNPVAPVSKYYKSKLRPGESLWWAADEASDEASSPPILRLWSSLTPEQKNALTVEGYALFPEILSNSSDKYQRLALWMVKNRSVVNTNIRDQFSAGGRVDVETSKGVFKGVPAAFGRIAKNRSLIEETIAGKSAEQLCEYWSVAAAENDRIAQWCRIAADYGQDKALTYEMLCAIFERS